MQEQQSVITLHKGRPAHLRNLMTGLARSGFSGDLVVVEMGDVTPLADMPFRVAQIEIAGQALPLAQARNAGRQTARGSDLIFLDVDCIPAVEMTRALCDLLRQQDALICANVRYLARTLDDTWNEAFLEQHSEYHPARPFPATGFAEAAHPGLFWSLAFAIRAGTFDRISGFDEGFRGYGAEDTDFAFRAAGAGVPILLNADAVAFHQMHANFDPPLQHFADIVRNAGLFRARHGFWPMQGWLDAFASLGLIEQGDTAVRILRMPTAADLASARTV